MTRVLGWLLVASGLWACGGGNEPAEWEPVEGLQASAWLMDVTASPDGEQWVAVGGEPSRGRAWVQSMQDDWQTAVLPDVPLLNWAQVFEDGTGFAVGNGGTVLRYDGTQWQQMTTPTEEDLWGVWGSVPDDVWAVGGAGRQAGQQTLMHYDGTAWEPVDLPELERPNVWALFKVWGTAADDVVIVGQHGVILHFDGQRWREQGAGTGEDLIALWGAGERVVAVGGRSSAVVAIREDGQWRSESLAPLPGLNGVWTADGVTAFVAGIEGTLAEVDLGSLDYEERYQDTTLTFHAIHGAGGRLVSVGGNLERADGPYEGLARGRAVEEP